MSNETLEEEFYRSGALRIGDGKSAMGVRVELVFVSGSDRGILYVYDGHGSGQVAGRIDELREIARTRYADAELHERQI